MFNVTENPQKRPLNTGPGVIYFQKPPQEVSSSEMCGQAGSPSAEARWDFAQGVGGTRDGGATLPCPRSPCHMSPSHRLSISSGHRLHTSIQLRKDELLPCEPPASLCPSWTALRPCGPSSRHCVIKKYAERSSSPLALTQTRLKCPRACLISQWTSSWGSGGVSPPARPVLGSFRFLILQCHYLLENFFLLPSLVDYEF